MEREYPLFCLSPAARWVCAFASLLAIVTRWLKKLARTRRHWHEAKARWPASSTAACWWIWGITRADRATPFRAVLGQPRCCASRWPSSGVLNRAVANSQSEARAGNDFHSRRAV